MTCDTRNSSMKNEIAKWLEGGWIVNSTRLRTAMRAILVRTITPIRALLLNLCVVMPCILWYRWYATRGEPTQKNVMRSPTTRQPAFRLVPALRRLLLQSGDIVLAVHPG